MTRKTKITMVPSSLPIVLGSLLLGPARTAEPIDIGSRPELLVDDYLTQSMNGPR